MFHLIDPTKRTPVVQGWCGVQSYKGWGLRPKWIEIENQKDFPVIVLVCLRKKVSQLQEIAPKMGLTAAPPGGGLTVEAAIKLLLYDGRVNSWIINGESVLSLRDCEVRI